MNKTFKILGLIGFFGLTGLFGFVSCKSNTPSSGGGWPKQFNLCYEEIYGHCYDSVPCAVVALDLYSDGLTLNEDHRIQGTGYNLYLSDIFVPDSLLEEGEYKSLSLLDFQPSPFTFLPGRDFEGTPHGMYLLQIEENRIARIQVLDSGAFAYRNDSLLFTLYYRNTYGTRSTYKCTFHGTLTPWQKP
jgi:hypothetical protein